jgi:hypothetical protein
MDFKSHLEIAWHQTLKNLAPLILMTLVWVIISTVTLGILSLAMMAGYIQSILKMMRHDRQPQIQDLFSAMNLFLPLLAFSIIAAVVIGIGLKMFVLPGLAVICALAFGCLYMVPLMVDRRLGLVDAVKASWQLATQDNLADQVVVAILFLGFIAIGSSVFIGTLLTQPFALVFLISVYLEKIKSLDESVDQPPAPS